MKRGLVYAIQYLKEVYPEALVSDDIHKTLGLSIKFGTLDRSLRRAANEGKVIPVGDLDNSGNPIVRYKFNPGYDTTKKPKETGFVYSEPDEYIPVDYD